MEAWQAGVHNKLSSWSNTVSHDERIKRLETCCKAQDNTQSKKKRDEIAGAKVERDEIAKAEQKQQNLVTGIK